MLSRLTKEKNQTLQTIQKMERMEERNKVQKKATYAWAESENLD
jgi:hypothetical protein